MILVSVNGVAVAAFKTRELAIQTVNTTYCNCGGVSWSDDKLHAINYSRGEDVDLVEEEYPIDRTIRVKGKHIPYFEQADHL